MLLMAAMRSSSRCRSLGSTCSSQWQAGWDAWPLNVGSRQAEACALRLCSSSRRRSWGLPAAVWNALLVVRGGAGGLGKVACAHTLTQQQLCSNPHTTQAHQVGFVEDDAVRVRNLLQGLRQGAKRGGRQ